MSKTCPSAWGRSSSPRRSRLRQRVEVVEKKIGEQRRQRSALRRALVPFDADAALHHPRLEKASDDPQQALVANPPCQTRHQDVVVDPVEKLFEVDIHDDATPVGNVGPGLGQRLILYPAVDGAATQTKGSALRSRQRTSPLETLSF